MDDKQTDDDTLAIYQNIVDNPKVPMTLRIGIAGPRHLTSEQLTLAALALNKTLHDIAFKLKAYIDENEIAKQLYDTQNYSAPILRLTSSLAIGVDRLIMSPAALDSVKSLAKYELAGVLPFLLEDCKKGFFDQSRNESLNDQDWLDLNQHVKQIKQQDKPRLIELDGDISSPESRDQAHFRCTQYLLENIDLLIVVTHDVAKSASQSHKAGTATTLHLAKEVGRPVIEIAFNQKTDQPNIHIHQARRFGRNENTEAYSEENLKRLLSRLVLFSSLFKLDELRSKESEPLTASQTVKSETLKLITEGLNEHIEDKKLLKNYNDETDFEYRGMTASPFTKLESFIGYETFTRFKRFLINPKEVKSKIAEEKKRFNLADDSQPPASRQPKNIQEAHIWFANFLRADSLAIRFASIHRSTYLLIYLFASSALIIAAGALTFQDNKPLVGLLIILEFFALTSIYVLYSKDHHNHHKWLQNRCLAEAIRPNIYLSQLGRCFSFFNIRSSDEFTYREIMGHNKSGAQWICIQAELINRHIGFGHCRYTHDYLARSVAFLKSAWVSGQLNYHLSNAINMQCLGARFSKWTHRLFYFTCTVLIIKAMLFVAKSNLWIDLHSSLFLMVLYKASSLLTAVFPILATAMFAIRNHSEFDISAQRSLTMLAFFSSLKNSFRSKENETSDSLDIEINRLTEVSAKEVSDWLEIYEVKESEPG